MTSSAYESCSSWVGTGQRLFEGVDTASLNLTLTDVRKLANNSAILTYVPG